MQKRSFELRSDQNHMSNLGIKTYGKETRERKRETGSKELIHMAFLFSAWKPAHNGNLLQGFT